MSHTTTTVTKCDNCGEVNTTIIEWEHELPSLASYGMIPISATLIGARLDYCPACVSAVKVAIESALKARKVGATP